MRIDLLMTTRNRRQEVRALLDSLRAQTRRNFRLLAGLQAPDSGMEALVVDHAAHFPVRALRLPECGLSRARNLLLPEADGDIIALTDDDCRYHREALAAVEDFFTAHPDVDACIGKACAVGAGSPDGIDAVVPVTLWNVFRNAPSWVLFFRREAMARVGMFDETLGVGAPTPWQSGEETDYAVRLLKAGGRMVRVGRIAVEHPPADYSRKCARKCEAYGRGRMALLRKHHFPLWFTLANLAYPLARIPMESPSRWPGCWAMFAGRLREFAVGLRSA